MHYISSVEHLLWWLHLLQVAFSLLFKHKPQWDHFHASFRKKGGMPCSSMAPYLMLSVQVNNSSAWPSMLPKVWPAVDALQHVQLPAYYNEDFGYMLVKLDNDLTLIHGATLPMCEDASLLG